MKKAIIAVLVVFLGFWLFTDPHGLATTAKDVGGAAWVGVSALFTKVIDFITDL
ncbi:hypothetical protein AB3X52_14340 [Nocardioides sp. DS6]|uniref:Uncharacterized protein n=1 Tax=Nocardioides eburneus TaxID=3231482 RepID=A0ABV3T0S9_9ACTN